MLLTWPLDSLLQLITGDTLYNLCSASCQSLTAELQLWQGPLTDFCFVISPTMSAMHHNLALMFCRVEEEQEQEVVLEVLSRYAALVSTG